SAGQAALHLSRYAASVTMIVRGPSLAASMSSYLATEISNCDGIRVRTGTEVVDGQGQCSLESLTLRDRERGATEQVPASALFVMVGAEPRTGWLGGCVARDPQGFILTGWGWGRPVPGSPAGRSSGRRCCWRPPFPASSPPVTCGTDRSSGSPRPWA